MNFLNVFKNFFITLIKKLRDLENKEQAVLISNLPRWYVIYQYNFYFRLFRLIAVMLIASAWHGSLIIKIINSLNLNFLIKNISTETFLSVYGVLFFFCLIFLFLHCVFNMIIRILYFKKIVKNSPISIAQCISTGLRICRYGSYGIALFIGIPGIDYAFERNGHIPPLRGYYIKQHIKYFGANDVNCAITEGVSLSKEGLFDTILSHQQDYARQQELKINSAYNEAKLE